MATGYDAVVGYALLVTATTVFSYYALWVVILPFVDTDHVIQQLFLPRVYAVAIPVVAGVCLLIALGVYITAVAVRQTSKPKDKTS